MEITPVPTFNLGGCLSESTRIFKANYTNFLALSTLFLPLSFSLIINPTFTLSRNFFTSDDHFHQNSLLPHLFHILIVYLLALYAIATITYTTHHGLSGKPVKFFVAFKSITFIIFPLVSTACVAFVGLVVISLTFLLFVGMIAVIGHNLGFVIDYNPNHFIWVSVPLIAILVYFLLNWSLALVVVVAESKWGFEALIRSSYLVKGMRSVSLSLLVHFGVFLGCTVLVNSDGVHAMGMSIYALVPVVLGSSVLTWFLVWSTAANTVLYTYCKAFHGEMENIDLPYDDEKVPLVVTVVEA